MTIIRSSLCSLLLVFGACATASEERQGIGETDGPDGGPKAPLPDAAPVVTSDASPTEPDPEPEPEPEPDPEPDPDPCTVTTVNLLDNGNLDGGQGGMWLESSSAGYDLIVLDDEPGVTANSGQYVAWLSGYVDAFDSLEQDVQVPADATNVSVKGVRWIVTEEAAGASAYDVVQLDIATTSGSQLEMVEEWSNQDENVNWAAFNFSLSGNYQGDVVSVRLRSESDDSLRTHFLFDSLVFQVTTCQ